MDDEKGQFDGDIDSLINTIDHNYIEKFASGKNEGSVSFLNPVTENSKS